MISLNIDENKIDLSQALADGGYVPAGWYKMEQIGEEKEMTTKNGKAVGAKFIYQILEGPNVGMQLKFWFATRALAPTAGWLVEKTNAICLRIAKANGMSGRLQSTAQLYGKPFYVQLTLDKSESKQPNDETGEMETKIFWNNNFAKGAPNEIILSVREYREKFGLDVRSDSSTAPRRIVKKAEATPVAAPVDAQDVPFEGEDEF